MLSEEKIQTHSRNSSDSSSEIAKNLADEKNKQTIYIRPLSEDREDIIVSTSAAKHNSSVYICPDSDSMSSTSALPSNQNLQRRLNETNNKIEIDSDNIETPPTVRKQFHHSNTSNDRLMSSVTLPKNTKCPKATQNVDIEKTKKMEHEVLGDGQFDRFSSARRTRRFRRPIDLSNCTEDSTSNTMLTTSPESTSDLSFPILSSTSIINSVTETLPNENIKEKSEEKESLGENNKSKSKKDVVTRIGKIGKSISKISQEDVREAIRSLKSPTPENEWNLKDSSRSTTSAVDRNIMKIMSHELNDEGFEETQSLVSDTPSLTTSSYNEEAKSKRNSQLKSTKVITSSDIPKRKPIRPSNQLQTLLARNEQSLERSKSLRGAPSSSNMSRSIPTPPRRTNSLRKPIASSSQQQTTLSLPKPVPNRRLDVERSNSRSSLRSSRSSLNSAVSTNTVKKMPLKSTASGNLSLSLPKKPLSLHGNATVSSKTPNRIPASRSSSSGSSVGSSVKKPLIPNLGTKTSSLASTNSVKDAQSIRSKISPLSSTIVKAQISSNNSKSGISESRAANSRNSGGFMRPTTASATKVKSK